MIIKCFSIPKNPPILDQAGCQSGGCGKGQIAMLSQDYHLRIGPPLLRANSTVYYVRYDKNEVSSGAEKPSFLASC